MPYGRRPCADQSGTCRKRLSRWYVVRAEGTPLHACRPKSQPASSHAMRKVSIGDATAALAVPGATMVTAARLREGKTSFHGAEFVVHIV